MNRSDFLRIMAMGGAGAALTACGQRLPDYSGLQTENLRSITLLYTNDEHGWMEQKSPNGGAGGMYRRWQRDTGYSPGGAFLVLSGGDSWTGPALSTWFKGESMVAVMNTMGYSAAAVGNHDFDFGVDVLQQRAAQANFPLLSANLREKSSGKVPDYVQPFTLQEVNGIRVGLIGLTTQETAVDTHPSNVANLEFLPYEDSLRQVVPQVKASGAQLMVIVGHLCTGEMRSLAPIASELGIPILCAGHCHEQTVEQVEDVTIVQADSFMSSYIRIAMLFNTSKNRLEMSDARLLSNPMGGSEPVIQEAIQSWHARADPTLWEVIGYAGQKIDAGSPEMAQLLTTPWLDAIPGAQIAFFSPRYVQSLPDGDITPATILGMIPTDNELVLMQLTGAQVIEIIETHHPRMGGLVEKEGILYLDNGLPLESRVSYNVIIPDGLFEGENYFNIIKYDPNGNYTGVNWRTPVLEWVRNLKTSPNNALEAQLVGG